VTQADAKTTFPVEVNVYHLSTKCDTNKVKEHDISHYLVNVSGESINLGAQEL